MSLYFSSWCLWELSVFALYDQIVIHYYITSDHDPYDVLWVVHLVLEDMGEVLLLVVMIHFTFMGLEECIVCWIAYGGLPEWQEPKPKFAILHIRE